jgi:uncharacterized membrane protein YsdA (DUF1294 family)
VHRVSPLQASLWIAGYLAFINATAFVVFAWDKYRARNGMWRVPERTLLILAGIGGSPAMIGGQYALRHKTWKEPFRTRLLMIAGLQAIAIIALLLPQTRSAFAAVVASFS